MSGRGEVTASEGLSALLCGGPSRQAKSVTTAAMMQERMQTVDEELMIGRTVDRLGTEFDSRFTRDLMFRIVRRCIDDLAGIPPGTIPELAERSARQRLLDLSTHSDSARAQRKNP